MNGHKRERKQVAYDVNSQKRSNPYGIAPLQKVVKGSIDREKQYAYPCQPVFNEMAPQKSLAETIEGRFQ